MEADHWTPDIIVGVDFGMTCTGVAYAFTSEGQSPPKTIQRWPGKMISELANKVPTQLEYHRDQMNVKRWGFECEHRDDADIKEYFKLNLSPHPSDPDPRSPNRQDALRWFQDYVRRIYLHVVSHFSQTVPHFSSLCVEFIFSVPTTWKDPRMIAEIESLLRFDSPAHRAVIGLTEAEAAAVYACRQNFRKGDVILVCDSGGATTDVNILKLASNPHEPTMLDPLGSVEGQPVGSVFIDKSVHQLITGRLERVEQHLDRPAADVAWKMIQEGRFQRYKCNFGSEMTMTGDDLRLNLPPALSGLDSAEAKIVQGQMIISWEDIKQCFDVNLERIHALLDEQIRRANERHSHEKMSYLVLSGGLGSSKYLIQQLSAWYSRNPYYPNIRDMQILTVDEPQVAVVQGLVLDRIQQIKRGVAVIGKRCCRVSYGILCDEKYDPEKHLGEPVRKNALDKKSYAINQIQWMVVQGQLVPDTGIIKEFQRALKPTEFDRPWAAKIVMSTLPAEHLPRSMKQGGAEVICAVQISLDGVEKKRKNRHWYNVSPEYWRVRFNLRVIIGPASLRFQASNKDGSRILSKDHKPIIVEWELARADEGDGHQRKGSWLDGNPVHPL